MPNLTNTTSDVFIPEVWSQKVNVAVKSKLVLADLVWRLDDESKGKGDTIHIPNITELSANDKIPGAQITLQSPTETKIDLSIDQHKETSFLIEDLTKLQASYNLQKLYTTEAGYAIAKAIDTSIAALATGFSQTKGTYNTAITTDVVLDSVKELDDEDVPEEDRHFVFRPDVKRDLLDLSTYTSNDFVDGKPVTSGKVGMIYGVMTHMSNNVLKSGNNTSNIMFHRHAIAAALQQQPRTQTEYSIKDLGYIVAVDTVYGVIENRDVFGVLVKT